MEGKENMIAPRKVLLIRPDHLGDVILSLPVAESLKGTFKDCQIYYLAAPGSVKLQSMAKYVDEWISDENINGRKFSLFELARIFRRAKFDTLIELKPSWRTAVAGFMSGVPSRVGTSRRIYSVFYNNRVKIHRRGSGKHQIDLELGLLKPFEIDVEGLLPSLTMNEICLAKAKRLLNIEAKSYIVIHPGSSGSAPNWSIQNFILLAQMITARTDYKIVITGQESEAKADFGQFIDLCGKTDLETLAGIIYGAQLFISGSTGPLHLADALGIKCTSFYVKNIHIGPQRWGPRRNEMNVLTPENSCKCARHSECHCLEQVTPEMAFNKISDILEEIECGTPRK